MKTISSGTFVMALALASFGQASPAAADATTPTCAANDPVVWENSSTKVYHAQGDSFYGKTKSGKYACQSDADKAGFHLSKSKSKAGTTASTAAPADGASASPLGRHHRTRGMTASPGPDVMASPDAMASPMGKHRRHRHGSMAASPAPSAT